MTIQNKHYSILYSFLLPIQSSPLFSGLLIIFKILKGLVPSLQILATAEFLDACYRYIKGGGGFFWVQVSVAKVVILVAFLWLSDKMIKFFQIKLEISLKSKLSTVLIKHRTKLKYHYIENPESWNLMNRVCKDSEKTFCKNFLTFLNIGAWLIQISSLLFIISHISLYMAGLILILFLPLVVMAAKGGKKIYNARITATTEQLRSEYMEEVLTGREAAAERTLFSYANCFGKMWKESYEHYQWSELKAEKTYIIRYQIATLLTNFISIGMICIFVKPYIKGELTLGLFISMSNALVSLIRSTSSDINRCMRELIGAKCYMSELSQLAQYECVKESPNCENLAQPFHKICIKDLKFRYPGADAYVLNGLCLSLEYGKHYALVGINGAGKTTLIKILAGLYENYEGQIIVDGVELREMKSTAAEKFCAVVFQDFSRYQISLRDNILLGNQPLIGGPDADEEIDRILRLVGLKAAVENLPNQLDTRLGKIYPEGVDLSGGEWQKIALARMAISNSYLQILDEPTSALDPITESKIYQKFKAISQENTVLFISHRLGSVKLADTIFVLENGRITETGTHEELVEQGLAYADMYQAQKEWYESK